MLAILKLLAWSERHTYTPRKDASDLFLIDHRDDGVTVINSQRTARQEIVLHIDDDKRVIFSILWAVAPDMSHSRLKHHFTHTCMVSRPDSGHPRRIYHCKSEAVSQARICRKCWF